MLNIFVPASILARIRLKYAMNGYCVEWIYRYVGVLCLVQLYLVNHDVIFLPSRVSNNCNTEGQSQLFRRHI